MSAAPPSHQPSQLSPSHSEFEDWLRDNVADIYATICRRLYSYSFAPSRDLPGAFKRADPATRPVIDQDDILQNTLIAIWAHWGAAPADPHIRRLWAFAIARNKFLDAYRAAVIRTTHNLQLEPDHLYAVIDPDPQNDPAAASIESETIATALDTISAGQRDVLELYLEGYGAEEAAQRLRLTSSKVRQRAFYARETLRRTLRPGIVSHPACST